MKIDSNKWINTLPSSKFKSNENNEMNPSRWIDTLPKEKINNPLIKYNNPLTKYKVSIVFFVAGLIFVSVIKNETRNLQKEIDNLQTSINVLKDNLHNAILDHQFITSPENISSLANEYLKNDFIHYKRSQIIELNNKIKTFSTSKRDNDALNQKKNKKDLSDKLRLEIAKKIEKKRTELQKIKEIYSRPEKLPGEIKVKVAQKVQKTKTDLKKLYSDPKDAVDLGKIQKWAAIQVVKAFFGMPIVPGK